MPLVCFALAAYLAGLYCGFADSTLLLTAATAVAYLAGDSRAAVVRATLAMLCIAGYGVAAGTARADAHCVDAALNATTLHVVLDDSASAGGFARGTLVDCTATVALSVDDGDAPAGATIVASGRVARTERGLLVQHATIVVWRGAPAIRRMRTLAGRSIDSVFRDDAPLVRALLIADRSELSPTIRDQFAAAGLAHVLAIAGLHIGIIALAFGIAFELAGVPRRRASVATLVLVVGYVLFIGAPIPAVRSATMLTVLLASRLAQRPTSRWAIVALGASQPVWAPRTALDVGYMLSVAGVSSMIAAGLLGRRLGVERLPWVARTAAATLLGTTVATIGSAPIVAWVFGRVSLIAPLTNLAAAPLIALAQPMIFCGLLVAPVRPLAALVADAAHPLLLALERIAAFGAGLPFASPPVAPTAAAAAIAGVLSIAVIVACASRDWERPAIAAVASAAALVWLPLAPARARLLELHTIDVGQGDAIAVRTPHSHWILIDAGRAWAASDAGRSTVVPYIGRLGGPLDMFVLSHPHTDHVGGAASVLHALRPRTYVDGGFPGPAAAYRASLDTARSDGVRWVRAHPGDSVSIDGVSIRFLAPDSTWTSHLSDPNLASVVALVQLGEVRMLLMGDAERPEEEWLLSHEASELRAEILKVGHHGSATSSSEALLDAVRPRVALVSVGTGNMYHLPTPSVMRRLAAHGAQVLRTDHLGTVVVRTDGHRIFIAAAGDEWELPPLSPP